MWTLLIPKTVNNKDDMKAVALGYPVYFIVQDFSMYDPPTFPRKYRFGSPRENQFMILAPNFLVSYFSVFILLYSITSIVNKK